MGMYQSEKIEGLQAKVIATLDINSYSDGATNKNVTVPKLDEYSMFVLALKEGIGDTASYYVSTLMPSDMFKSGANLGMMHSVYRAADNFSLINFQIIYVNDTTIKVRYKNTYSTTWPNIYAELIGIK